MNLQRRHLNESQRAMVAAKLATMRQGERTDMEPSANLQKVCQSKAADMMNISVRTLADAKKVQAEAQPEVIRAVEARHIAVSAAVKEELRRLREQLLPVFERVNRQLLQNLQTLQRRYPGSSPMVAMTRQDTSISRSNS